MKSSLCCSITLTIMFCLSLVLPCIRNSEIMLKVLSENLTQLTLQEKFGSFRRVFKGLDEDYEVCHRDLQYQNYTTSHIYNITPRILHRYNITDTALHRYNITHIQYYTQNVTQIELYTQGITHIQHYTQKIIQMQHHRDTT